MVARKHPAFQAVAASLLIGCLAASTESPYTDGIVAGPDDVRIYYRKAGTGKAVVILPSRLFAFKDFAWLAEHFTLISYDMRNRGRSSRVEDGSLLTLEKDVEDMEAIRAHFGVESFSAIGYSYLGKVIAMYARENPDRVERLVQIGTVPPAFGNEYPVHLTAASLPTPYPPEIVARLEELRARNVHETDPKFYCEVLWRALRYSLVGDPENANKIDLGVCEMPNEWPANIERHLRHHFTGSAQLHVLTPAQIAEVIAPVLVIHGTHDRNAPYGGAREWAMRLPNARLITVDGAAHHVWADEPEVFDQVLEFLQGDWPADAEIVEQLDPLHDIDDHEPQIPREPPP